MTLVSILYASPWFSWLEELFASERTASVQLATRQLCTCRRLVDRRPLCLRRCVDWWTGDATRRTKVGDCDHATFLLIFLVFCVALNFQQSSPCSDTRHLWGTMLVQLYCLVLLPFFFLLPTNSDWDLLVAKTGCFSSHLA